jgi:transposase
VELTFNWYWLVDGLIAAAFDVRLANLLPSNSTKARSTLEMNMTRISRARVASWILLPKGYIYAPEERKLRDLARKRLQLVRQRAVNILSIESLLARHLNLRMKSEEVQRLDGNAGRAFALPQHVQRALQASLAVIETLSREIHALELIIHREVRLRPEFAILKSTPGIGEILAAPLMLETGTITRVPGQASSAHTAATSRAGACPTAGRRVKATRRMATAISLGPSSRPWLRPGGQTLLRTQEGPPTARRGDEGARTQAGTCGLIHDA